MDNNFKKIFIGAIAVSVIVSSLMGGAMGFWAASNFSQGINISDAFRQILLGRVPIKSEIGPDAGKESQSSGRAVQVDYETAVVNAVERVSPSVVSIIVTKDLPIIERYYSEPFGYDFFRRFFGDEFGDFFGAPQLQQGQRGTRRQEVGGGTGFIVSADGYILTNKHVVSDEDAQYTVLENNGSRHEAKVLARDPINDIAVLKIEQNNLPLVELGDSSRLKVGQLVIAIGNSLGEFRNTVSTGVISGLSRSVVAGGLGFGSEQLTGVIQTDASINLGNSGGPLLNLSGQVIGMNTAMALGAENIGFAIPINEIKSVFESVKQNGRIVRPWLGIRYVQVNKELAEKNTLSVDYGALIVRGNDPNQLAVIPGSPADKAGLLENDIVLEINGKKVDESNLLAKTIAQLKVGDEVSLKVLSKGKEKTVNVKLEEMK